MNGKPDQQPNKANPAATKPLPLEPLVKIRPLIRQGKEGEVESILEAYFESHEGPLPSARDLASYEATCPGAAERILKMAEKEQDHRHGLETTVIGEEATLRKRGQWMAAGSLLAMLLVVGWFALIGAPQAGAALGTAVIVGVVAAFLGPHLIRQQRAQSSNSNSNGIQTNNSKAAIRAQKKTRR